MRIGEMRLADLFADRADDALSSPPSCPGRARWRPPPSPTRDELGRCIDLLAERGEVLFGIGIELHGAFIERARKLSEVRYMSLRTLLTAVAGTLASVP